MRVIRAAQLFDGERFLGPSEVLVDGAKVVAVIAPSDHSSDVEVEDLGDATVLPGLVDAHQHLSWDCSVDPVGWHANGDDILLEQARVNARRALAAGITTIRDLGGRTEVMLALRDEAAGAQGQWPALLVSGAALTSPHGHCHFLGGECAGLEDLVAMVRSHAAARVDVIKVMATGGNVTPGSAPHESQFRADELRAVVEAAHAAGLPVAAHAHAMSGVSDALDAGVDTIEHCSFMTADGVGVDPGLVERLAQSGTVVSITAGVLPGGTPPPAIAARLPALIAHGKGLVEAGVRCILSTDAGIGPVKPHDTLAHAVAQQVDAGLASIAEVLAMCTSRAADALGLADQAGRLAPGHPADLLVVRGRADQDPAALLNPLLVLRAGREIPRA